MVLILSKSCRLRHGWLYSSIRRYPKGVRTITPGKYTGREGREGGEGRGRGERERNLHIFPSIGISFHLILKCELIIHSHTPSLILCIVHWKFQRGSRNLLQDVPRLQFYVNSSPSLLRTLPMTWLSSLE